MSALDMPKYEPTDKMNALDEYRAWTPPEPGLSGVVPKRLADAAIAELEGTHKAEYESFLAERKRAESAEAELERLKCCGSCAYTQCGWSSGFRCYAQSPYHPTMQYDHCHTEWFDGESLWEPPVRGERES
jgi:hypothetical protein